MSINKLWLFQDESGEPAKSDYFISGFIRITSIEKSRLLDSLSKLRAEERFFDEMHYQKFSNKRFDFYKKAVHIALTYDLFFKCIVVPKTRVDINRFGKKHHIAYNYFTKQVMVHGLKHRNARHVHIRVDDKNRIKADNFLDYLKNGLNYDALNRGYKYQVRSVKPNTSDTCDMLQLCDLFLGATKCRFDPAEREQKNLFSQYVMSHPQRHRKMNIWDWKPHS